jgi:hypothetical protein
MFGNEGTTMRREGWNRKLLLALVTIGFSLDMLALAAPSQADTCVGEQTIFSGDYHTTNAYGTTNTFDVRNRPLGSGCGSASAWSTAQLGSSTEVKQVEVGWNESLTFLGDKHWCMFWEAQNGNASWGGACRGAYDTSPNTNDVFRVAYNSTYDTFRYYIDVGNGFVEVTDPGPHGFNQDLVAFTHGWPKGEVGRSASDVGAADDQSQLQYRSGSTGSNWVDWTFNGVQNGDQDSMPGWKHCRINDHHFTIIHDNDTC